MHFEYTMGMGTKPPYELFNLCPSDLDNKVICTFRPRPGHRYAGLRDGDYREAQGFLVSLVYGGSPIQWWATFEMVKERTLNAAGAVVDWESMFIMELAESDMGEWVLSRG